MPIVEFNSYPSYTHVTWVVFINENCLNLCHNRTTWVAIKVMGSF